MEMTIAIFSCDSRFPIRDRCLFRYFFRDEVLEVRREEVRREVVRRRVVPFFPRLVLVLLLDELDVLFFFAAAFFLPPPVSLWTVAHARRSASPLLVPLRSYPSSM